MVYGDPIGRHGALGPEAVLALYVAAGIACVGDLDGAFALVAIHSDSGQALIVTDRTSALKCFVEETADALYVVSSLSFLSRRARPFDPVAIVSYLCNGAVYNRHTIFEGVQVLSRASVHVVSPRGVSSTDYESFRFDGSFAGRRGDDLRDELCSLLVRAVARRTPTGEPVYLSLSGGSNSAVILGCLSRLGRRDIACFSYSYEAAVRRSDAFVAQRRASIAGFGHTRVPTFDGDLGRFIDRNVEHGECRATLCLEVDAWHRMRQQTPDNALVLVGDGCFGWEREYELPTEADLLAAIPIRRSKVLESYARVFNLRDAGAAYDDDMREVAADAVHDDPQDTRDYLALDQRLCHLIMPWRELFPSRPVRNPLLDRELLEFMKHVPAAQRIGKRLFKETVYGAFPDLYGLELAVSEPEPWLDALRDFREALKEDLRSTSSPVDRWVAPTGCLELLESVLQGQATHRAIVGHGGVALGARRPGRRRPPTPGVAPAHLLLRMMVLRRFARLADSGPDHRTGPS